MFTLVTQSRHVLFFFDVWSGIIAQRHTQWTWRSCMIMEEHWHNFLLLVIEKLNNSNKKAIVFLLPSKTEIWCSNCYSSLIKCCVQTTMSCVCKNRCPHHEFFLKQYPKSQHLKAKENHINYCLVFLCSFQWILANITHFSNKWQNVCLVMK